GIDLSLARAATLVVGLIIAHSLVDYPLRTGAIMGLLAFACGLLVEPLGMDEKTSAPDQVSAARPRQPSMKERLPAGVVARQLWEPPSLSDAKPQHARRWGEDIQWPSEWRAPDPFNRKPSSRGKPDR